jgi:hypothetical protein
MRQNDQPKTTKLINVIIFTQISDAYFSPSIGIETFCQDFEELPIYVRPPDAPFLMLSTLHSATFQ